jgi:hypothetical protein
MIMKLIRTLTLETSENSLLEKEIDQKLLASLYLICQVDLK